MKTTGAIYSVYYLVNGWSNFTCRSITGQFTFEQAEKEVENLKKQGFKSASVKNGKIIGGLCSSDDFETDEQRKNYWDSL